MPNPAEPIPAAAEVHSETDILQSIDAFLKTVRTSKNLAVETELFLKGLREELTCQGIFSIDALTALSSMAKRFKIDLPPDFMSGQNNASIEMVIEEIGDKLGDTDRCALPEEIAEILDIYVLSQPDAHLRQKLEAFREYLASKTIFEINTTSLKLIISSARLR